MNSPFKYIDPTGLNVVNFDKEGTYIDYTEDDNGWDYVTANVDGTEYSLHDPNWNVEEMDPFVNFMEGKMGSELKVALNFEKEAMTLAKQGTEDVDNIVEVSFASMRHGPMDFATGPNNVCTPQSGNLFMLNGIIYNVFDAGNYVWGGAMNLLGYELGTALLGAHLHNFLIDPKYRGTLDSKVDQQAIVNGYFQMGRVR